MSGLKKSPSGNSIKSAASTTITSSGSNGISPKMESKRKFECLEKLKKYFKRSSPPPGNRVGCQLWPVLTVLKCGGNLPLFVTEKGDQFVAPSFSSVHALPPLTLASLFLYWWVTVIVRVLQTPKEESKTFDIQVTLARVNAVVQSLIQISEIAMGWLTCRKMAEFMNNWQTFETNFNGIFKDLYKYKINIRRCRDFLLIFYVTLPALYFMQNQEWILMPESSISRGSVLSTVLTLSLVVFSFTEDVKTVLMYRVTQENFRETRNGIAAQYKMTSTSVSKTPLGPEKVKQWIQLVNIMKNQQKLACEIQAPHHVLATGLNIILLSNNLFLFVHSLAGYANGKGSLSYLPLGVFAINFLRLLFKCVMAEKVAEEEQTIADELVQMEGSGGNIFIKMELKFLYDLIVNKPAVASLYSVITLNKAFALQVLGHVLKFLTLLILFNVFIMVESPVILSY